MNPLSIRLKNFFSHKNSFVDFSLFDSVLLLGNIEGNYDISNGSGKSAIFEGILWGLFSKARSATVDDVVMWGELKCEVEFIFIHESVKYKIIRTRDRSLSDTTVSFYREGEDGTWIDLSGSTSRLTNAEILKKIKFDFNTFVNSVYFGQNDISKFTDANPSDKKTILKSIIDISKWDEYEAAAKTKYRGLNDELKVLSKLCEGFEDLQIEVQNHGRIYSRLKRDINKKTDEKKTFELKFEKLTSEYNKLKKNLDTDQWDRIVDELAVLNKQQGDFEKHTSSAKKELEKYREEILSYESQITNGALAADAIMVIDVDDEELEELNGQFVTHKASVHSAEQNIKRLGKINIVEGKCFACGQEVCDELHEELVTKHIDEVNKHKKVEIFSNNKINEIAGKIENLQILILNKKKRDAILSKVSNLKTELKYMKEHFEKVESDYELSCKALSQTKEKISLSNQILESLKNDDFKEMKRDIETIKGKKTELEKELENDNREFGIYTEKLANGKKRLAEMAKSKDEYAVKHAEVDRIQKLAKMFGKNGIQTILLNSVIEDLEKTANRLLSTICSEPIAIFLETQRVGSDGVSVVDTLDLKVNKDGVNQNFKSLSGGEAFRVSLALRIALSEISSRHGGAALEFLLLDEINSPLDKFGTEVLFVNIIRSLEKKYKIMVITHDESLKEKFADIIDVSKINGESKVSFVSI